MDLILICIAYYSAYFLRFEGSPLLASNIILIKKSLIWIILVKMSVFFIFGLYRGIWKYVSISDLLTIFKVVSISSISSVLFFTFVFRFKDFSRTVFFIDWLLLLFLITGTRILFRALAEFLIGIRDNLGKRILIIGAGDTGEMVIREIKRNKSLNYHPIGFIDDDPSKIGNKIQGISVLGTRSEIKKIIRAKLINEIIIAIPSADNKTLLDIIAICKEMGTPYRNIKGILDKEDLLNPDQNEKNN